MRAVGTKHSGASGNAWCQPAASRNRPRHQAVSCVGASVALRSCDSPVGSVEEPCAHPRVAIALSDPYVVAETAAPRRSSEYRRAALPGVAAGARDPECRVQDPTRTRTSRVNVGGGRRGLREMSRSMRSVRTQAGTAPIWPVPMGLQYPGWAQGPLSISAGRAPRRRPIRRD